MTMVTKIVIIIISTVSTTKMIVNMCSTVSVLKDYYHDWHCM